MFSVSLGMRSDLLPLQNHTVELGVPAPIGNLIPLTVLHESMGETCTGRFSLLVKGLRHVR